MRLPPSVQTEAVLEYLAGRLTQPWMGCSADALIAAAITDTQPIYAPSDLDDLSRCFFAFYAAPDELRRPMLPHLARWATLLAGKDPAA